jgi:hypothetical protein
MTTLTYYVAVPFLRADDGTTVTTVLQAEILSQAAGNVGAIAFGRNRCAGERDTNAVVPAR